MSGEPQDRALAATHEWFERNSGWAPPDEETLADWLAEGLCRAPDDCMVTPEGTCPHGLVAWSAVLEDLARYDANTAGRRPAQGAAASS